MYPRRFWLLVGLTAALAGCGRAGGHHGPERIEIRVTARGFEPALVAVAAGRPVTLVVTRRTERTCATEFVLPARGIRRELPLDRPVEITFTPESPGDLRYACGMDMISGIVRVR